MRGRREPHVLEGQETHHGPIVTGLIGAEGDEPLALAWTGLREPFFTRSASRWARWRPARRRWSASRTTRSR